MSETPNDSYDDRAPSMRPRKTDYLPAPPKRAFVMEEWVDSEGVKRYKLMPAMTKVDDDLKARIVAEVAEHGRLGTACRLNKVGIQTIKRHIEKDPAFGASMAEAYEAYKDRLIEHHQNLVFNGTTKTTYGRDGNVVSEEQVYPIRLIELELKKHDEGYRDKKEVNMNVRGGVVVAPAEVSMEDWESRFGSKEISDIVDGEFTDIGDASGGGEDDGED